MKKKIFFFILLLVTPTLLQSSENYYSQPNCVTNNSESTITNLNNVKIRKIDIKINKYKKWTENGIRIAIGNFRWIPSQYKKRFKARIVISYENGSLCTFKAKIRHNGDQKDHIKIFKNSIIQSLDVHLSSGHVYGVTKFKLLLKNTRGKDEIFLTTLLRKFNYLSPRTMLVNVSINNVNEVMIFQEKAAKELLEHNFRREGPILEGDERFVFRLAGKLPDNNLSNASLGMTPLLENGINGMLSRQTNSKIIERNKNLSKLSFTAVSNLNLIYLLYTSSYKDEKNNFLYSNYTLNNNFLALEQTDKILKLDIYNLLMNAANAGHGLSANNRKFYWNSILNFFEPINYDSNANIDVEPNTLVLPVNDNIDKIFLELVNMLNQINVANLAKDLNFRGLIMSHKETKIKIQKLKKNLKKLKNINKDYDVEIINYNKNKKFNKNMWMEYFNSLKKIDQNIKIIKQNSKNSFKVCETFLKCDDITLSRKDTIKLLEGNLTKDKIEFQFIGNNIENNNLINNLKYKKVTIQNSNFYYDEKIEYKYNIEENELNIYQVEPGARAFFSEGNLKNLSINFYGNVNKMKFKENTKNFPIDINSLTGCLSLINTELKDIKIRAYDSTCEDSINLINVSGVIEEIEVKNSFLDALDIDFSNVELVKLTISNAGNDCLDVSAGTYKVNSAVVSGCGDKGVSVGEKSIISINDIEIHDTNLGVASKDSSIVTINNISLNNIDTCLSAYNKKQEYSGGYLSVNNFQCTNFINKLNQDAYSKILF